MRFLLRAVGAPLLLAPIVLPEVVFAFCPEATAQTGQSKPYQSKTQPRDPALPLHETSSVKMSSAFTGVSNSVKCDEDGNLYFRSAASDRPMLGPVIKVDPTGKKIATFNPSDFTQLMLDRADAFTPSSDGGLYQIAQRGVVKSDIYVLHYSSDGTPSSSTRLEADLEVYTFGAFTDGTLLLSGTKRNLDDKKDQGRNFTAVFTADGRELAQLSLKKHSSKIAAAHPPTNPGKAAVETNAEDVIALDLAEAEVGSDGYLYVMRRSAPAMVYAISPTGTVMHTFTVESPVSDGMLAGFRVSSNRLAISFFDDKRGRSSIVVIDAQTGRKIATYASDSGLGAILACYSANEESFTFLRLEESGMQIVHADSK